LEAKIDGLGFRPRALVFWWSAQASWGSAPGNRGGVGLVADGGQSAVAWASHDGAEAIRASRWLDDVAIIGFETAGADRPDVRGRAVAFDDSGFVLEWLTRPRTDWIVHYLALGGSDLTEATVFRFTSIDEGFQYVDGPKFPPDFVLLVPSGAAKPGDRAEGVLVSLGVATDETSQAVCAFQSRDAAGAGESRSRQQTSAVAALAFPAAGDRAVARLVSTDSSGFTLEWSGEGTKLGSVICLALKGGRYKIGTDVSPKAPGTRRTRRLGFRPSALLAFSWGLRPSQEAKDVGRLCFGAAASRAQGCATWDDEHRAAPPTKTHVHSTDEALILVPDTQTGGVHAAAGIRAVDPDSFTLEWARSDGPAREFVYVAFGSSGADRPLRVRLLEALIRFVPFGRHRDRRATHEGSPPERKR
jgi:hypothetical protein